jgi:hypothetical protein
MKMFVKQWMKFARLVVFLASRQLHKRAAANLHGACPFAVPQPNSQHPILNAKIGDLFQKLLKMTWINAGRPQDKFIAVVLMDVVGGSLSCFERFAETHGACVDASFM